MALTDPSIGVKDLLVAGGIGVFGNTTGWSINIGGWPDNPDTAILINMAGGRSPFPHLRLNFPSVHIQVRGAKGGYAAAFIKMQSIVDVLLGRPSGVPSVAAVDWWQGVTQLGDVAFVGFDENKRPVFTANFSLIVQPASGTHRTDIS